MLVCCYPVCSPFINNDCENDDHFISNVDICVSPFGAAERQQAIISSFHIIQTISFHSPSQHLPSKHNTKKVYSGVTGGTFSSPHQCASPPLRYVYCHFLVSRSHHDLYCILRQVDNFSSALSPASFTPLASPHPSSPLNHPTSNNHFAHHEETFPCFRHTLSATPWKPTTIIPQQECNA